MELHSSLTSATYGMQFDKRLLNHLKQKENDAAKAYFQSNPNLLKLSDSDGCTLLHYAVQYDNIDMMHYLIDAGIDVNVQDRQGRTAVMTIASHPNTATLTDLLLKANAYVHLRDNTGKSALQIICDNDFQSVHIAKLCVRNLIAYYSDDNDKLAKLFLECENPLFNLIYAGYPMLTRALLKQGYPVNFPFNTEFRPGRTALHIAVENNDLEHVKTLVECGAYVNAIDKTGSTPFCEFRKSHRSSYKMLSILKILLDQGAWTTTLIDNKGNMPVEGLLLYGGKQEIQLLRQYNLNLRAKDEWDQTPLHRLALNDCKNIFEELRGMDFDVNARDDEGRTPLHYAVGNCSSLEFLLKNGANANALDQNDCTPLHLAFNPYDDYRDLNIKFVCDVQVVELLLESGANPQAINSYGWTVIQEYLDTEHKKEFITIKPVLAHLAMLEARGTLIKKRIQEEIYRHDRLKKCFISYVQLLKQMKEVKVWDTITLYDLLMESDEKLAVYMRNKDLVLKLVHISKKYIPHSNYYFDFLQRRVEKTLRIVQVKDRAAVIISKLMQLHYGASHIISIEIASYLNYDDLLTLVLL